MQRKTHKRGITKPKRMTWGAFARAHPHYCWTGSVEFYIVTGERIDGVYEIIAPGHAGSCLVHIIGTDRYYRLYGDSKVSAQSVKRRDRRKQRHTPIGEDAHTPRYREYLD